MAEVFSTQFISGRFAVGGRDAVDGPMWCMTLVDAPSMRFKWNESNPERDEFLAAFGKDVCALDLLHSKYVFAIESSSDLFQKRGDGIITRNCNLMPVVTVADCVPIFVYDAQLGVFGVLHSGWRGTGIVAEAFILASKIYGSRPENFSVVIGPHIGECCYEVEDERAAYFEKNFGEFCVSKIPCKAGKFSLSLTKANLGILKRYGIPIGNIKVINECTCCFKEGGKFKYNSFRRQVAAQPDMALEEKMKCLKVHAAFVAWD